jgi:DNA invertase Pin-like site-specific DNA recombinase
MQVAIYIRVSKADNPPKVSRQVSDLRKFCKKSSWQVIEVVKDPVDGRTKDHEGTERLIDLARSNHIQKVVVTEVSRLGRSLSDVAVTVEALTEQYCSVLDFKAGLETLDESGNKTIFFDIIIPIFSGLAQQRFEDHSHQIRVGLKQARLNGRRLGRPRAGKIKKEEEITALLCEGLSIRKTAAKVNVSDKTVKRVRKKREIEIKRALADPELQLTFH